MADPQHRSAPPEKDPLESARLQEERTEDASGGAGRADDRRRLQRDYVRYSGLGLEFSITVALVGWLGYLLDGALGLTDRFPLFLLLGLFLGMGLGIYRMKLRLDHGASRKDPD